MTMFIKFRPYRKFGLGEGVSVAGEELTTGAEETTVAGEGAYGGGGGHCYQRGVSLVQSRVLWSIDGSWLVNAIHGFIIAMFIVNVVQKML